MKLYQKSELTCSRIFFDKKPPMFMTIFIVSTCVLLLLAVCISSILTKTYIVEAQGTITTMDNAYVGAFMDGIVVEIKQAEGSAVTQGDVLFTISNGNEGVQYDALNKQLDELTQKQAAMDLYMKSLNEGSNYLKNAGYEQEYYGKMEYYLSILKDESKTSLNNEADLQKKLSQKSSKEQELQSLKTQLQEVEQKKQQVEQEKPKDTEGEINPEETLPKDDDTDAKKQELASSIETKQSEIDSLQTEIEQLERQSESTQGYQTKLQLISELGTARSTLSTNQAEIEGQINAYKTQDSHYEVKANKSGYVHYLTPLKEGMTIQKAQTIGEISENQENQMIVEAYINATDISKVSIEDEVKVSINGVNQQKYGTLQGTLKEIDAGTLTQETNNGNVVLYRCLVSVEDTTLTSSKGEQVKVLKSMPVTARIVYEKETYLDWILEQLSFKN